MLPVSEITETDWPSTLYEADHKFVTFHREKLHMLNYRRSRSSYCILAYFLGVPQQLSRSAAGTVSVMAMVVLGTLWLLLIGLKIYVVSAAIHLTAGFAFCSMKAFLVPLFSKQY